MNRTESTSKNQTSSFHDALTLQLLSTVCLVIVAVRILTPVHVAIVTSNDDFYKATSIWITLALAKTNLGTIPSPQTFPHHPER